ncbi:hypothetical protein ATB96_02180 [Elizabethkingia ursingii]|nr:hypothetical protein ATB96_02180 [Elizabethkingia ursingii]
MCNVQLIKCLYNKIENMYLNNQFIHAKNTRHSSRNIRHGHVFSPESRPYFAWKEGKIDKGALNQIESGKFFPMAKGGAK